MKRTTIIVLIIILLLAGGTFLYFSISAGKAANGQAANGKKAPLVQVVSASRSTISEVLELTGSVEAYRVAQLASPAEGPVENLRVREGDRVRSGRSLLSIGRTKGADALVKALREDFKKEEDNLKRTRQLVESNALPGEQLDQATSAFERANAQLIKAEESMQDYTITAPWDGIVSRVMVKDGDFVAPRSLLVEIYDPASLIVRTAAPEKQAVGIKKDMSASLYLDAYPGIALQGKVARVYPYLDQRMRTRTIEIEVIEPTELLPGMFARLELALQTAQDAVVVPTEAVITSPKGDQAVFLVESGKAVQRQVKTGIEQGNRIQIITGIEPGDTLIVAGHEKLKDGVEVRLTGTGKEKPKPGDNSQTSAVSEDGAK